MDIKKAAIWGGATIFVLVMGWMGADRVDLLFNSSVEDAVVVSCKGKPPRRRTGPRGRSRSWTYAPVAVTASGVKVKGSLSLSGKSWCEPLIGTKTTVLVHDTDVSKSRINSYIQFWLVPAFFLTLVLCFLAMNNRVFLTAVYVGYFVLSGFAVALEYQWLGGANVPQASRSAMALNQCIKESIAKEGASSERTLRKLVCVNLGITDIADLGQLESLEELYLQSNNLTSLEPLRRLRNLRTLSITKNRKLGSFDGLENLHALEVLRAHSMKIRDISALQNLKHLRFLSLGGNEIEDISALAGLDRLETLRMPRNPVKDITALQGKPSLSVVVFYGSPIADISPLYGNSALKIVGIRGKSTVPCDQFIEMRARLSSDAKVFGEKACG